MEPHLPPDFQKRMRDLFGDSKEADALFAALQQPPHAGLRVNTGKVSPEAFATLVPDTTLRPIPWCAGGFAIDTDAGWGRHPYHAAGLYYLQEPSAMAVGQAVDPQPGDWVLDMAAAPGGKSTHVAALLGGTGLLVANEIERSRTRALLSNLERWGTANALVTNERPERLAKAWGATFDRVLVDAPCSGEGMFRKSPDALSHWSVENIAGCATRQQHLLQTAADLVRPGGYLVYSTCTFAPEENEGTIARFLAERANFALLPLAIPGAEPGRPEWAAFAGATPHPDLHYTARLWPHKVEGEGHFIAMLQRSGEAEPRIAPAPRPAPPEYPLWQAFAAQTLSTDPFVTGLALFGDQLHAVPEDYASPTGLAVLRTGLWLGTLARDRFEPSHSLALALSADDVPPESRIDFAPDDSQLARYLHGETWESPGANGWVLITVSGYPVGWGRRAQNIVKNYYPKGLRR